MIIFQASAQKVSQFDRAGLCDLLIDKSGVYHAIFQESPGNGKPTFIYYASSSNKGKTWTAPVTISNDNTGNGAGYARVLQDGNGYIYAIWKRYGTTNNVLPNALMDGPGGYALGTLFYRVLSGGTWGSPVQLSETEATQNSWFASLSALGNVYIGWSQLGPTGIATHQWMWYYCDDMRMAVLNGTAKPNYGRIKNPSGPVVAGGPPPPDGALNMDGYIDAHSLLHYIYETTTDNNTNYREIKYFDGKAYRTVYTYPNGQAGLSYNYPPKLLHDENGTDHLIFKPSPLTLEGEEIWDINLATNKTTPLVQLQKKGVTIKGFQATQGPKGAMAVTIEAGGYNESVEGYGLFYERGNWMNIGLTKNASKAKVFYRNFIDYDGWLTSLTTITRYNSLFTSIAYDPSGKKSMLMNLAANWMTAGGLSTFNYSEVFSNIDR